MSATKNILERVLTTFSRIIHSSWAVIFPKCYAKYIYKKISHRKLDLSHPKDFNEKIQWLKLYSDISQWSDLADEYKVREYIEKCGLKDILVKLYGVWKKADEIDFNLLPDKFVLKTNNAYGRVIAVKDKSYLDVDKTRKQLNKWVKDKYGYMSFEPHYWKIKRRIIAEEYLQDNSNEAFSYSLVDYKFWCIHGEPYIIMALYNRENITIGQQEKSGSKHVQACVFDLNWNIHPETYTGLLANIRPPMIPKPKCFDEMIRICRILSKPFPQVRVDLYEVNNKVYFGELTFTAGGNMDYFSADCFMKMGEKMDLSTVKHRTNWFIC